jgi:CO/xanthine dehydrogenase Mo-binding subunit
MSDVREFKQVGTRPIRPDGVDKVTGRANYGADLQLPGMLSAAILRSPHAHARIVSIDLKPALALEGVKAAITGADLPVMEPGEQPANHQPINFYDLSRNVMAKEKVLYDGHAVAAVAATTPEIAKQALALIDVRYEVLPHVQDVMDAIAPGAPILDETMVTEGMDATGPTNIGKRVEFTKGNVEEGFAAADVIIEREFDTKTVHQGYIEPHAVVARSGADGQCVVWCSTQGHFAVRSYSAKLLGMDVSQIKVIPSEIGGGFGGKTTIYLEPVAILLSQKAGRPVRLVMSREEVFRASGPAPAGHVRIKLGATRDGKIVAADGSIYFGAGAFKGSPFGAAAMTVFTPYDIPNAYVEAYDIVVNKPKVAAYRAPGGPISSFGCEQVVDELANELGIDPIEIRLRNAAKEGTETIYGPKLPRVGMVEVMEALKAHPHYQAALKPNQGRGIAAAFWFNAGMQSSAAINVNDDGTATVISGNPDIGGSRASLALMAAEELQIPVDKIRPIVADTENSAYSDVTGGSRVTFAVGAAVIEAGKRVVKQLRERAALLWEAAVEDVGWEDGRAVPPDGLGVKEELGIREIAQAAGQTGGPIAAQVSLNVEGVGPSFAAHICDVEVDPETGYVKIVRYTAAQDVGKAVHPSYVEGQLQGGTVQGIGWALNEEYIYNAEGCLENPGFLDYRMPVASDLPMIDTILVEVPNPGHPYGVRGVGETSIVPPLAAVANAISDATGLRLTELPMSPPRVLAALEAQEGSGGGAPTVASNAA